MPEVHIWHTLAGVVALTPEGFGFSFCSNEAEIAKLRADLQAGVPMSQAVGFSGSHCSFQSLVRVESKENSPTVFVVARDFLGKAKEDFTFQRHADREAFLATLLELLGPGWRFEQAKRGGFGTLVLPIIAFLFGLSGILCSGCLLAAPSKAAADPKATPPPSAEVLWIMIGLNAVVLLGGLVWFLVARQMGKTVWETIRKK
jgi:hypothetical protein